MFCGTNFCDWGNCLFFLGINFCDFPEAAFYLELLITFSFFEYKQSNAGEQHADVYNTLNQLINGVPSDDPFL